LTVFFAHSGSAGIKAACRTLMKLSRESSWVNFISVLQAAFTRTDPNSTKIKSSHQYLFALLGCAGVKATSKTLMKLTPCLFEKGETPRKLTFKYDTFESEKMSIFINISSPYLHLCVTRSFTVTFSLG